MINMTRRAFLLGLAAAGAGVVVVQRTAAAAWTALMPPRSRHFAQIFGPDDFRDPLTTEPALHQMSKAARGIFRYVPVWRPWVSDGHLFAIAASNDVRQEAALIYEKVAGGYCLTDLVVGPCDELADDSMTMITVYRTSARTLPALQPMDPADAPQ